MAVLPTKAKSKGIKRKVSEKTKALFEKRTKLRGKGTAAQFKSVQSAIKRSSLDDYESWVDEWAEVISDANGHGDTKKIYQAVRVLAQKQGTPPSNLTTDKNGKLLTSSEDVAQAWESFLSSKFATTQTEDNRSWGHLPPTKGTGGLTDAQFDTSLKKLNNRKACGPDGIPVEIYKHSHLCNRLLKVLLKKIWVDEEVPVEFARATFIMLSI